MHGWSSCTITFASPRNSSFPVDRWLGFNVFTATGTCAQPTSTISMINKTISNLWYSQRHQIYVNMVLRHYTTQNKTWMQKIAASPYILIAEFKSTWLKKYVGYMVSEPPCAKVTRCQRWFRAFPVTGAECR